MSVASKLSRFFFVGSSQYKFRETCLNFCSIIQNQCSAHWQGHKRHGKRTWHGCGLLGQVVCWSERRKRQSSTRGSALQCLNIAEVETVFLPALGVLCLVLECILWQRMSSLRAWVHFWDLATQCGTFATSVEQILPSFLYGHLAGHARNLFYTTLE